MSKRARFGLAGLAAAAAASGEYGLSRQSTTVATVLVCATIILLSGVSAFGHVQQARRATGRIRAGWAIAAFAATLWGTGNALRLAQTLAGVRPTGPGLMDLLGLLSLVATFPVMLLLTPASGSLALRARRLIDVGMIAGALFLLAWQIVLHRVLVLPSASAMALVLLIPAMEVILAAMALVVLSRSDASTVNTVNLFAGSMLLYAVVTLGFMDDTMTGADWNEHGVAAGYLVATALTTVVSRQRMPATVSVESEHFASGWALLPYLPVGLAFGTAAVQQARHATLGPVLPWALLATSVLVLLRQFLSVRTHQTLLRTVSAQRTDLAHQASHDGLTGLANRRLFTERAERALAAADPDTLTGVILVDLDGFKGVNDTYGHAAGDDLLVAAGTRMRSQLRDGDTVARLGGDEFAIVLPRLPSEEHADAIVARVLRSLGAPLAVAGATLPIRASVGVAVGRGSWTDLPSLLRQADVALYRAKADGKGRARRHDAEHTITGSTVGPAVEFAAQPAAAG